MIHLIAAVSENNVIGKDNDLLWHIPNDLKRFKKLTLNHPIIMGRKTFESFGSKPLPKRHHFIVSSSTHKNSDQITWVKNLENALEQAKQLDNEIYVIGGGSIYKQAMPFAQQLDITRIHKDFEGDTYFPDIPSRFKIIKDDKTHDANLPFSYSYRTYKLIKE